MREALEELGYDPNSHRSQGITPELLAWANKIVVMGNVHERYIAERHPEFSHKVSNWNVKDPHFATGNELHRTVAKQLMQQIYLQFG
jgi:protein-tyrosine-phosphatase